MATNDQSRNAEPPTLDDAATAVRKLAEVLESHGLAKVEVTLGDLHIRLSAGKPASPGGPAHHSHPAAPSVEVLDTTGHIVAAPMIGTFYSAPSPGEPPFVSVGDEVEVGQTIGIIEAMKIMNEIACDRTGVVAEVYVANSQAVEYGSPLIRVIPA